jgi:peptidoglycan/LPS O-acetylase OafA/YrhL
LAFFSLLVFVLQIALQRTSPASSRRRRILLIAAIPAGLATISLLWKAWSLADQHRSPAVSSTTWFGPIANLDNFAIGMAIAVIVVALRQQAQRLPVRGRIALRVAGAAIILAAITTRTTTDWFAVYFTAACALGFGCLVAAAVLTPSLETNHRPRWKELLWFESIAYGTYLWHEPILLALNGPAGIIRQTPGSFAQDTVVVLVLSAAAGWLSHLVIQRPADQLLKMFVAQPPCPPTPRYLAPGERHGAQPQP